MSQDTKTGAATERVEISCPGCGRHDWVTWPAGQETLAWKCFNCGKPAVLKAGAHH
jgi:uncharacterized Zn finger protein